MLQKIVACGGPPPLHITALDDAMQQLGTVSKPGNAVGDLEEHSSAVQWA